MSRNMNCNMATSTNTSMSAPSDLDSVCTTATTTSTQAKIPCFSCQGDTSDSEDSMWHCADNDAGNDADNDTQKTSATCEYWYKDAPPPPPASRGWDDSGVEQDFHQSSMAAYRSIQVLACFHYAAWSSCICFSIQHQQVIAMCHMHDSSSSSPSATSRVIAQDTISTRTSRATAAQGMVSSWTQRPLFASSAPSQSATRAPFAHDLPADHAANLIFQHPPQIPANLFAPVNTPRATLSLVGAVKLDQLSTPIRPNLSQSRHVTNRCLYEHLITMMDDMYDELMDAVDAASGFHNQEIPQGIDTSMGDYFPEQDASWDEQEPQLLQQHHHHQSQPQRAEEHDEEHDECEQEPGVDSVGGVNSSQHAPEPSSSHAGRDSSSKVDESTADQRSGADCQCQCRDQASLPGTNEDVDQNEDLRVLVHAGAKEDVRKDVDLDADDAMEADADAKVDTEQDAESKQPVHDPKVDQRQTPNKEPDHEAADETAEAAETKERKKRPPASTVQLVHDQPTEDRALIDAPSDSEPPVATSLLEKYGLAIGMANCEGSHPSPPNRHLRDEEHINVTATISTTNATVLAQRNSAQPEATTGSEARRKKVPRVSPDKASAPLDSALLSTGRDNTMPPQSPSPASPASYPSSPSYSNRTNEATVERSIPSGATRNTCTPSRQRPNVDSRAMSQHTAIVPVDGTDDQNQPPLSSPTQHGASRKRPPALEAQSKPKRPRRILGTVDTNSALGESLQTCPTSATAHGPGSTIVNSCISQFREGHMRDRCLENPVAARQDHGVGGNEGMRKQEDDASFQRRGANQHRQQSPQQQQQRHEPQQEQQQQHIILLICSEAFVERWGEVIVGLMQFRINSQAKYGQIAASGNSNGTHNDQATEPTKQKDAILVVHDTPMLAACQVDIEFPGSIGVIVASLEDMRHDQVRASFIERTVKVAGCGRYRHLIVFLVCPSTGVDAAMSQSVAQIQNALLCFSPTPVHFYVMFATVLSAHLDRLFRVKVPDSWGIKLRPMLANPRAMERVRFLLNLIPTLSLHEALWMLDPGPFNGRDPDEMVMLTRFQALLGKNNRLRAILLKDVEENPNRKPQIRVAPIIQLQIIVHAVVASFQPCPPMPQSQLQPGSGGRWGPQSSPPTTPMGRQADAPAEAIEMQLRMQTSMQGHSRQPYMDGSTGNGPFRPYHRHY